MTEPPHPEPEDLLLKGSDDKKLSEEVQNRKLKDQYTHYVPQEKYCFHHHVDE